jgi:hypothetical protein
MTAQLNTVSLRLVQPGQRAWQALCDDSSARSSASSRGTSCGCGRFDTDEALRVRNSRALASDQDVACVFCDELIE